MTIPSVRNIISKQVNSWFRTPLEIEERAFQALEISRYCQDGWIDSLELFGAALQFWPAMANIFLSSGIRFEIFEKIFSDLKNFSTINRLPAASNLAKLKISNTLKFCISNFQLKKEIKKRGRLELSDLIVGSLEMGLYDGLENPDYQYYEEWKNFLDNKNIDNHYGVQIGSRVAMYVIEELTGKKHELWTPKNMKLLSEFISKFRSLEIIDRSIGNQQFIIYYDGAKYRFRPFGVFGGYKLEQRPLKDGSLWIARGNLIQPSSSFSEEAFVEIEDLINKNAPEKYFQQFFEKHPEFILCIGGGKYIKIHPQIIMNGETGNALIPDFFLEKANDQFCDLCDLKLASQHLSKIKRNRSGFYAAVYEAIAQLDHYRNWFEDKVNRNAFFARTGLNAYRPRVVVIIGRALNYYKDIDRIQKEALFPSHVELITYDEIVARARQYINLLNN